MDFRITTIRTVKGTQMLYVDVEFLDGDVVLHRNDFIMQVSPTKRVYVGPPLLANETPDPKNYEIQDNNEVAAEILANIDRYRLRVAAWAQLPADSRSSVIPVEDSDPLGLRAKPGVAQLIGAVQVRA